MSSSLTPPAFSSSTLWAAPSRDWIIAPKAKPGRKPTNDPPPRDDGNEPNHKSRRVQNRTAQRAFRERKQSQLADLQARVQSYEQGEIERSVALQNVSKRLKEENEALRRENRLLKEKIVRMERQELAQSKNRREQSLDNIFSAIAVPNKRIKRSADASSADKHTSFTHPPLAQLSQDLENLSSRSYISASYQTNKEQDRSPKDTVEYTDNQVDLESCGTTPSFGSCGLCDEVIPCLCREIAGQEPLDRVGFKEHLSTEIFSQSERLARIPAEGTLQSSILDNLPPYQPAVPLRRKQGASSSSMNSIFPVIHLPPQGPSDSRCSGDPSNCLACADDAFGKAFCTEIGRSISSRPLCVGCPCNQNEQNVPGPGYVCCGSSENCRSCPSASQTSSSLTCPGIMPTNEAWKKIKEHPNVSFADLSLLAEVVARRSKCTGPTVVISPAPGEATPERVPSPDTGSQAYSIQDLLGASSNADDRVTPVPVELTSPRHSISVGCGHKGPHEVYAVGVQDALHLLDKFS